MMKCALNVMILASLAFGGTALAAPINLCPNTPTSIILTESIESTGIELVTCMLPPNFAPPLITAAFGLLEGPRSVPPLVSDLVVVTQTGLVTFYSDPTLFDVPNSVELQTEAAQNIFMANGTTYVVTSDVGPEMGDVPEPSTAVLFLAGSAFWMASARGKLFWTARRHDKV